MDKSTYTSLVHSKYFNPAFNAALFDGPLRIYFSQAHEFLALKIYFSIQQKLAEKFARVKNIHEATGKNVLVLIYPNSESFSLSFENKNQLLALETLDNDDLMGVNGPFDDQQLEAVLRGIENAIDAWVELPPEDTNVEATATAQI